MELEINDIKTNQKHNIQNNKNKELLMKIIKEKLDIKISRLERRNKMQLAILNITNQTVKNITEWSLNANKKLKEKNSKKNKTSNQTQQKSINKNKKPEKIEKADIRQNNTRKLSFRSKTPLRTKYSKNYINEETRTLTLTRNNSKTSKYYNAASKGRKTPDTKNKNNYSFINKKKKKKSIINSNTNQDNDTSSLRRPSVLSNKSNKISTVKKNKNTETPIRKKTPYKKIIDNAKNINIKLSENKSSENVINSKIIKKQKNKDDEITKMETALQKGEFLRNNDPLLISPITDLDFLIEKKNSTSTISLSNLDMNTPKKKEQIINLVNKFDEKIFEKICFYLKLEDIIQYKNISKFFHKLFMTYILKYLNNQKNNFNDKLKKLENNIDVKIPIKKPNINEFNISQKSIKAIKLLNEPNITEPFFQDSSVNKNILIIYRIFFQLIKHPYKDIPKENNQEFFEKCKYYFSHNGKIGDLLTKIIDEKKLYLDNDNLYKIYQLAKNDLEKIYPNYFSNICGNTGLITFIIKDILDFVGISNDVKVLANTFWAYNEIIESLNNKINYFKNSKLSQI